MDTKIRIGKFEVDVSRVTKVTANELSDGGRTYTLAYDGEHDDTTPTGKPLPDGQVADYGGTQGQPMPKDARANVGNRQTFTEEQLVRSRFFDLYNEINGTSIGPGTEKENRREQSA